MQQAEFLMYMNWFKKHITNSQSGVATLTVTNSSNEFRFEFLEIGLQEPILRFTEVVTFYESGSIRIASELFGTVVYWQEELANVEEFKDDLNFWLACLRAPRRARVREFQNGKRNIGMYFLKPGDRSSYYYYYTLAQTREWIWKKYKESVFDLAPYCTNELPVMVDLSV